MGRWWVGRGEEERESWREREVGRWRRLREKEEEEQEEERLSNKSSGEGRADD